MHVHWRKQGRRQELTAVLVERCRVGGKPRQRLIRVLAAIRESEVNSSESRTAFWRSVDRELDALQLASGLRSRVEARLVHTVERPVQGSEGVAQCPYVGLLGRLPTT